MAKSRRWAGRYIAQLVPVVIATYGTTCHLCGEGIEDRAEFSIDHVIPRSTAPHLTWDLGNMRPAHRVCNMRRGNKPLDEFQPVPKASRAW